MIKKVSMLFAVAAVLGLCGAAPADVFNMGQGLTSLETVHVGNPGNTGELSGSGAGGYGPDAIVGAVDYEYRIGKYEVTAGQYTEFLNAVATTDAYGLYNTSMDDNHYGCQITRHGSSGSYWYDFSGGTVEAPGSIAADWANRPVNFVSWGDSARFANWLHNGQPTGVQDLSTTEDGAYFLNGATTDEDLLAATRDEADWKWAVATEDEWYKAAYYDGDNGLYKGYPTGTDAAVSNDLIDPDPGNNATFYITSGDDTIGFPYSRTNVGAHENSESLYGTFDQGGNVWEWNEAVLVSYRGLRGGAFNSYGNYLHASYRHYGLSPTDEYGNIGFRVSEVPEPATMAFIALGSIWALRRWRLK